MEQRGIRELFVDSLNVSVHQTHKDHGHAVAGSLVQTAGGKTQVGVDMVGFLDMTWGHGRAKKTRTWSRDLILVFSSVKPLSHV